MADIDESKIPSVRQGKILLLMWAEILLKTLFNSHDQGSDRLILACQRAIYSSRFFFYFVQSGGKNT